MAKCQRSLLPTEIWAEIFDQLLHHPVLFNPDPLSATGNPHTSLRQWYNYPLLESIERQRRVLRLVSSSWKALADKSPFQYLDTRQSLETELRMVRRVRLGIKRDAPWDLRTLDDYEAWMEMSDEEPPTERLFPIVESFVHTGKARNVAIITLTGQRCLTALIEEALTGMLPAVKAISVEGYVYPPLNLVRAFPNLTFLGMQVGVGPPSGPMYLENESVFPDLKILQLAFEDDASNIALFQHWQLPKLEHLEITVGCTDIEAATDSIQYLHGFLKRVGPTLTGLKIYFSGEWITLPSDLWDIVPRIVYLGVSTLSPGYHCSPPPQAHPLRTLANVELETGTASGVLYRHIEGWTGLTTVIDSHIWENIPPWTRGPSQPAFIHRHCGADTLCRECIIDMHILCTARGWRYEDKLGRTWKEYCERVEMATQKFDVQVG